MTSEHLESIDPGRWPGVARVPAGTVARVRARRAEARFADACAKAGLSLDPAGSPDLVVEHEELFARLGTSGWLGLAESFMAGEWHAEDLAAVLRALISTGYRPAVGARPRVEPGDYQGAELPAELVKFSSGDQVTFAAGAFSSGVPTTVRTAVESFVRGAGHGDEPARHFVDVTEHSAPVDVARPDLGPAQRGALELLLDAVDCHPGTHLLEYPGTGSALAVAAAERRATVDTLTADRAHLEATVEQLTLAGVRDSVATELIDSAVPVGWRGRYDAVVSVERYEQLSARDRPAFLTAVDHLLAPGGRLAMQTVVATDKTTATARRALDPLRAYLWPALDHPPLTDLYRRFDRGSALRVVAERHLGSHLGETLRLQEETFAAHHREAAAEGFDAVFRRLWRYQFALRRALVDLGMLDLVQLTAVHRHRRGRR
ncbi:cyclopropane-fatty-acyl-phospholipid synthase [Corynebacterium frankenforstense DSM 45800]|uniref:Cyclopropane-fatty-acyl-phospholipid synthase n=1 Tax=Corynebacterium frankenforstense DSM 45800 TaxID=1437875 RepID=A0A1L7CSQ1_9CORY|nr:class I SAM-dependent methyltransferase [Corynebacterium frankenforstense]APT88864.1 cyclopropane-fatty-acyl-phospholipid synthase [Corynebacterium frankenforstense DSM 45800]